jgi:hypothetical protein
MSLSVTTCSGQRKLTRGDAVRIRRVQWVSLFAFVALVLGWLVALMMSQRG